MKLIYLLAVVGSCLCAPTVVPEFDEIPMAADETPGFNPVDGFGSTQGLPTFPWNGGQGGFGGNGGAPFGGMIPEGNQGNNNNQFGGFGGFGGQQGGQEIGTGFGNQNQNPFGGQQGNNLGGNGGAPFGGMIPEGNQGNNGFGQQGNGIFPGNTGFGGFNGQQGNQGNFNGNLGNQGNFNNNGFGGNQGGEPAVTDITGPLNTLLQNVLNSLKSQVTGLGNAINGADMDNLVSQLLNPSVPQDQKQTLVQNALNSIQDAATKTKMQQVTTALTSASTQLQGQNQQVQQAVSQILSLPFDQQSSQLPVEQLQNQVQSIVSGLSQQDEEALFSVMNRFNIDINRPATMIGTQ